MMLNQIISLAKSLNLSLVEYGQIDGNAVDIRKKQFIKYASDSNETTMYCEYKISRQYDGSNNLLYVKTLKICNTTVIKFGRTNVDIADILCLANDLGLVISDYGEKAKNRYESAPRQYAVYMSEDPENKAKISYEHSPDLMLYSFKINKTEFIESTENTTGLGIASKKSEFNSIKADYSPVTIDKQIVLEVKVKDLLTKSEYRIPVGIVDNSDDVPESLARILNVLSLSIIGKVVDSSKKQIVYRSENLVYTISARKKKAYKTFELGIDKEASQPLLPSVERNLDCESYVPVNMHDPKKHRPFTFKAECVAFFLLNKCDYKLTCSQFGVSDSTLWNWLKNYQKDGIIGLVSKTPGPYITKYDRTVKGVDDALTYKSFRKEKDKEEEIMLKDKRGFNL